MIKNHIACIPPSNLDIKLWRYMDLCKFADLILNRSVYFARADEFDDIFEGSLPSASASDRHNQINLYSKSKMDYSVSTKFWNNVGLKNKKKFAINCWHMNNYESAAMWKLYLKTNEGIAIQTTCKKLIETLDKIVQPVYISIVKYIDYDNDFIDEFGNIMSPFVHKRKSFIHEQEIRAIISSTYYDLNQGGIRLPIDLDLLIENIFVAPNSSVWFTQLIKDLVNGNRYNVTNSKLDDKPIF